MHLHKRFKCRDSSTALFKHKVLKQEAEDSKVNLEERGTCFLTYHSSESDRFQNLSVVLYEN